MRYHFSLLKQLKTLVTDMDESLKLLKNVRLACYELQYSYVTNYKKATKKVCVLSKSKFFKTDKIFSYKICTLLLLFCNQIKYERKLCWLSFSLLEKKNI